MTRLTWSAPLLLLLLLLGCATTISPSGRVGMQPAPDGKLEGVPVQLTTPAFVITEKPADTGPTSYTLSVVNRPDPSRTYQVTVAPAQLSSSEYTLGFGAQGQLNALGTTQTPTASALIKPIGDFVAGAVSIIAKVAGAVAVAADTPAGPIKERTLAQFLDDGADCHAGAFDAAVKAYKGPPALVAVAQAAVKHGDFDALAALTCDACKPLRAAAEVQITCEAATGVKARLRADLDDAQNAALLYPQTSGERALFDRAADQAKGWSPADFDALSKNVPEPARTAISTAVDKRDAAALKAVKCDSCDVLKKAGAIVIKQRLLDKPLKAATKLSANEWKHRHATWLETRIDDVDKKLGLGPPADEEAKLRKQRDELETQLATTIGASNELARARVLQALLQRKPEDVAPKLSKASNAAGMSEYEIAGKELSALQTLIAAKRQAVKPPGAPAPAKAVERTIAVSASWKKDGAADAAWAKKEADKASSPEFFVTVEEGTHP